MLRNCKRLKKGATPWGQIGPAACTGTWLSWMLFSAQGQNSVKSFSMLHREYLIYVSFVFLARQLGSSHWPSPTSSTSSSCFHDPFWLWCHLAVNIWSDRSSWFVISHYTVGVKVMKSANWSVTCVESKLSSVVPSSRYYLVWSTSQQDCLLLERVYPFSAVQILYNEKY